MAVLLVQHKLSTVTNGSFQNVVSFTTTPGVNHLLIVAMTYFGGGSDYFKSLSDNQTGNTYTQVSTTQHANATSDYTRLYYCVPTGSTGTFTITADFSNGSPGSGDTMVAIYEYSGAATSLVLDTSNQGTGNSSTVSPGAVVPANNGSLIFSVGVDDNGNNATPTANTGAGYTLEDHQDDSTNHERFYTEDLIQGTAGSTTASFTIGVASNFASIVGVFKPAPAAGSQIFPTLSLTGIGV